MRTRYLLAVSVLSFGIFLALAIIVKSSAPFGLADFQAALWFDRLNLGDTLNALLVPASLYGREYFWVPIVAVMLFLGDKRTRLLATGLAALFLVGIVAGEVAKDLVMRERPWIGLLATTKTAQGPPLFYGWTLRVPLDFDFSFPSGHALIVSIGAFYSLVTFRRKWVASLLAVEAAVVCFSRVYVGAHYPTDVLGGVALGAAIVLGGLAVERRYLEKDASRFGAYLEKVLGRGWLSL